MSILEKIAWEIVTPFLEAAAEQGWHMRSDEVTEEMIIRATKTPKMQEVNLAMHHAHLHGFDSPVWDDWDDSPLADAYRAMLAAAPEFEWESDS